MYNVASGFHALSNASSPITRIRIYFIDDTIDCTDDNDVQTNGTLLKWNASDTDSNKRISENGITLTQRFVNSNNIEISTTVSSQIQMTLVNRDGALSGFGFGRCKIYLDVYDSANSTWLPCPLGVFEIDEPIKTKVQLISCGGYDQMQRLDKVCDDWWNGLDWTTPLSPLDILTDMASQLGIALNPNISSQIVNASVTYSAPPITGFNITYRNIVTQLAGITGTVAFFDRDGALNFRYFETPLIGGNPIVIDTDTIGNNCLSLDLAEYSVPVIDGLQILAVDNDVGVTVGDGLHNLCSIVGNGFINGNSTEEVSDKAFPIFNQLATVPSYSPMTFRAIYDWSIDAGDIIYVLSNGTNYALPIFQQRLTWRGGYVIAEAESFGDKNRTTISETLREKYRLMTRQHQFEVDLENFRSMIQDLQGNYTSIEQTVNAIKQTVSNHDVTITDILDPTGEIWTAITSNSSDISDLETSLNGEISERKSYIRFIPQEPAIVLGVDTGNEIKLKLVNNIIYFFSGEDDSTDLSLAYAYFNAEETGASRLVAKESVQIGDDSAAGRWKWQVQTNGDLVLDYI